MNDSKDLLRFTTAGSVDDGKSTLIGRLLYDSKSIYTDQLEAVELSSKSKGHDYLDLSLITDGLKSEREQGITIDVAYRYFETPRRKFIIADTPGHIQYTRNMVTGASTANLALILIDARKGIVEQTCRHAFIASLLGISHIIVCINKMDLVDYSENVYRNIVSDFKTFAAKLSTKDIQFIPISALKGDNVVNQSSENMSWYKDSSLLRKLETIYISSDNNLIDKRIPIQHVIRPHRKGFEDFRGYTGRVEGGVFRPGDKIKVLPTGLTSSIKNIFVGSENVITAFPPMSVTITLNDDIDISRGDMIVSQENYPEVKNSFKSIICWMSMTPLKPKMKLIVRHTTAEVKALITNINYEIDINTLHKIENKEKIEMNGIAKIEVKTSKPLCIDRYDRNRNTGGIIFIDPKTNETLGAGMIM